MVDGGDEITGDQLRRIEAAILDAYRSTDDLERLLLFFLNRRLSHHAALRRPLPMVVFQLIQAAESEGWLRSLIQSAVADRPGNGMMQALAEPSGPAAPDDHRMLDTAFFDLDPIKRAIVAAKRRDRGRVLGFGLHSAEESVVRKLCSWLPHCLGETECKYWLSLRPDMGTVDYQLKQILDYRPDLDLANVVCPILIDGASAPAVAAFWDGIRGHFGAHEFTFVALFVNVGGRPGDYPDGVVALPAPAADETDLTLWAQQIVSRKGWPPMLADFWATKIAGQCASGDDLDMRRLFEAMDRSIRDFRRAPVEFRQHLEEWGSRADPSPC